jgi:dTDP-glucose 4,6-dehydratase
MTTAYSMSVRFLINMSAHHDLRSFRLNTAFKELAGARILLTGGTGFVGKWLLQTAKDAQTNSLNQVEIVVPTRQLAAEHVQSAMKIGCPNVSWIEGNFLEDQIDIGRVDMIIHAATPASAKLNAEDPYEMLRVNVAAMESVLRLASNDTPLLFTSSGAVYGTQPESMTHVPEWSIDPIPPMDQLNAYAQGKQAAERMCREAGDEGRCNPIIARLFAFGGEHLPRDTHFAIGNFVQNALDRKPIIINGDGRARRSYLYGADMATWLWSALAHGGNGEPLHIGSEHSISILELAQNVARVSSEVLNYVPEVIVSVPVNESSPVHQYVPSTAQTRNILNVEEWTGLNEIIARMMKTDAN